VRGDIYRLRARRDHAGHEQTGARYAVILQSDHLAPLSTTLVAPTSTSAQPRAFRPEIDMDGTPTRVLVDQMGAADLTRLGDFAGRLTASELADVDEAVRLVTGLF
jgi:mRNA interferase MazF